MLLRVPGISGLTLRRFLFAWAIFGTGLIALAALQLGHLLSVLITTICALVSACAFILTVRQITFPIKIIVPVSMVILFTPALIILSWLAFPYEINNPVITLCHIYVSLTIIGSSALHLLATLTQDQPVSVSRWLLLGGALLLALIIIVRYVGRVPIPLFQDEALMVNLPFSLNTTHSVSWLMRLLPSQYIGLLYSVLDYPAGVYMGVAGVGVPQMRAFFLMVGLCSLPFLYATTRHLYGALAAIIAVAIFPFLILSFNYARNDIVTITATSIALYFLVTARKQESLLRHIGVGFFAGFCLEGHPYGIRFIVAFGLVYLIDWIQLWRHTKHIRLTRAMIGFSLGGLFYLGFYAIFHLLIPGAKLSDLNGLYAFEAGFTEYPNILARMIGENARFYANYVRLHAPEAILAVLAIWVALRRRQPSDRLLLTILITSLVVGTILLAHQAFYYGVYNDPFLAILIGGWISRLGQSTIDTNKAPIAEAVQPHPHSGRFNALGTLIFVSSLALCTADIIFLGSRQPPTDAFVAIGHQIDQVVPPETTIVADQIFWLGMTHRTNFISSEIYSSETYYMAGGVRPRPPLEAFAATFGNGEMNDPSIIDNPTYEQTARYALTLPLKRAYCFYSPRGNEVVLMLSADKLPTGAPIGCKP